MKFSCGGWGVPPTGMRSGEPWVAQATPGVDRQSVTIRFSTAVPRTGQNALHDGEE